MPTFQPSSCLGNRLCASLAPSFPVFSAEAGHVVLRGPRCCPKLSVPSYTFIESVPTHARRSQLLNGRNKRFRERQ